MNKKTIKLALAVNQSDSFESKNFCFVDRFRIYEYTNNDFVYLKEIVNEHKLSVEDHTGASANNVDAIIALLISHDINIIVSSIFGRNIQIVNSHFIPVIVSSETPDEVISAIRKHIKWIEDELEKQPEEFKLFTIKKGILKSAIKKIPVRR